MCSWPQVSRLSIEQAIRNAFLAVDEAILGGAGRAGDPAGSTAAVAVSIGKQFVVAHVGDSRAVLCRRTPGVTQACLLVFADGRHQGSALTRLKRVVAGVVIERRVRCRCVCAGGLDAFTLTSDHTPDRKDELERILAAGGHVFSTTKGANLPLFPH